MLSVQRKNNQDNLKTDRCKENAFLEKGFKNRKKALEKFESNQCHRAASTYEILIPRCYDVPELFDNKEKEALELNRRCFMAISDSIQYLACQGIPLRRHGSDEDLNFFQLLMMKTK